MSALVRFAGTVRRAGIVYAAHKAFDALVPETWLRAQSVRVLCRSSDRAPCAPAASTVACAPVTIRIRPDGDPVEGSRLQITLWSRDHGSCPLSCAFAVLRLSRVASGVRLGPADAANA